VFTIDVVEIAARSLVDLIKEWRSGPETDQSRALRTQMELKKRQVSQLEREIDELDRRRFLVR